MIVAKESLRFNVAQELEPKLEQKIHLSKKEQYLDHHLHQYFQVFEHYEQNKILQVRRESMFLIKSFNSISRVATIMATIATNAGSGGRLRVKTRTITSSCEGKKMKS